mmetsp:Transcript_23486/g.61332  ORF Transcript_23486/g.61332 Transcript_23486/m.61332 type:complete len:264 (-) Transcript_23486:172-963(-)
MEYAQSVSTKCACFSDAASMTAVRPCASRSPASAPAASILATRATSGLLEAHSSLKWRPAWARASAAPVVIAASTSPTPIFFTALMAVPSPPSRTRAATTTLAKASAIFASLPASFFAVSSSLIEDGRSPASASAQPSSNLEKASSASKDAAEAWNCVSLAASASSVRNPAHASDRLASLVPQAATLVWFCTPFAPTVKRPSSREKLLSVSLKKYQALGLPSSMGGLRSKLFLATAVNSACAASSCWLRTQMGSTPSRTLRTW